ncbi:MAG: hypothetical protein LBQ60_19210 [Bacteroidales bacterium]|nr:hypothetical protein [Bacteroidales bacterium]
MYQIFTRGMAIQDEIIFSLEENITRILLVAEELKVNNLQLKQQVEELSEAVRVKNQEIEALEVKYQSLKLTKTLIASTEDIKNVKLQVNRMVREIDKCIALLNR